MKRPYKAPRIVRYQTPKDKIEEYSVSTGTNVIKCTVRGTCTGGRSLALPEWLNEGP